MITATVSMKNGEYKAFTCSGHAEYADAGYDIVCSAVSMLVINTANAIEKLTDNEVIGEDKGRIHFEFIDSPDDKGKLLMDALIMGLEDTKNKYGKSYLTIDYKEV